MSRAKAIRVLMVEDSDYDAVIIRRALRAESETFDIEVAPTVAAGRRALERSRFDLVLLDHRLPDGTGLEFLSAPNCRSRAPPVVMLSGQTDTHVAKEAIRRGAVDYLAKSRLDSGGLARVLLEAIETARQGERERRRLERNERLALRDPLTGLYNRRYLMDALSRECQRAKRYGRRLALVVVDVDNFKGWNDALGHLAGDATLRRVARVISRSLRASDIAARYGGDEFCILLPETGLLGACQLAERLRRSISQAPVSIHRDQLAVTVSAGVYSPYTADGLRPRAVLAGADAALRAAKGAGRNVVSARAKALEGDTP